MQVGERGVERCLPRGGGVAVASCLVVRLGARLSNDGCVLESLNRAIFVRCGAHGGVVRVTGIGRHRRAKESNLGSARMPKEPGPCPWNASAACIRHWAGDEADPSAQPQFLPCVQGL